MTQANSQEFPAGVTLLKTLRHHKGRIGHIAWSPDGKYLASPSFDKTVGIWDVEKGELVRLLEGHEAEVSSAAWSPDGKQIATGSRDTTVRIWDSSTASILVVLRKHYQLIRHIAWSPDGTILASASDDYRIYYWDTISWDIVTGGSAASRVPFVSWSPSGKYIVAGLDNGLASIMNFKTGQLRALVEHSLPILSIAWLANGNQIITASRDHTLRVWDFETGNQIRVLTEVEDGPTSVTISSNGRLVASRNHIGYFRLWTTDTWESLAVVPETIPLRLKFWHSGIAFHPTDPTILATLGENDTIIRIWKLDEAVLRRGVQHPPVRYRNAKVALLGDSGVGKSGLALALTSQPFQPTASTHGRHVYKLDETVAKIDGGEETREVNLWDLAGQPGYRLIHQLQLDAVAVALIVFDAGGGGDPLGSIRYWHKALLQANRVRADQAIPLKVFLVAARADRGDMAISPETIKSIMADLSITAYFETSALEGWGIEALKRAILDGIIWDGLPQVSSTDNFLIVKDFLAAEAKRGRVMATVDELHYSFVREKYEGSSLDSAQDFAAYLRFTQMHDIVRRLSFGDYVLMQPEKLDAYASSIVFAAREDVEGFGSIAEQDILNARFRMPDSERIPDQQVERFVLIAAVEDLLRHEIAFRDGDDLVFPSQLTREREEMRDPVGAALVYTFEGALLNIYTRLVIRLGRSGIFRQQEIWRNAVIYRALGGLCGVLFRELDSGVGEITVFYREQVTDETRQHFEQYIDTLLRRLALTDTVRKRRIITCLSCGETLADRQVERRRERGYQNINCPVCDTEISLLEPEELLTRESQVSVIDRAANAERDRDSAQSVVRGKEEVGVFDVFLSHNGRDKAEAIKLKNALAERGVLAWLDIEQLPPGDAWRGRLERALKQCKTLAYLMSANGEGRWQQRELDAFMAQDRRVIPVILASAPADVEGQISGFLQTLTWVDFRRTDPDPLDQLIWGILGEKAAL